MQLGSRFQSMYLYKLEGSSLDNEHRNIWETFAEVNVFVSY